MHLQARQRVIALDMHPHLEQQTALEESLLELFCGSGAGERGYQFVDASDVQGGRSLKIDATDVFRLGTMLDDYLEAQGYAVEPFESAEDLSRQATSLQLRSPESNIVIWLTAHACTLEITLFEFQGS